MILAAAKKSMTTGTTRAALPPVTRVAVAAEVVRTLCIVKKGLNAAATTTRLLPQMKKSSREISLNRILRLAEHSMARLSGRQLKVGMLRAAAAITPL
jgi:hypothetical protein